jgi:hypothetical protein
MPENYRRFVAGPDPFGRTWQVEFRWLQTAISIRHSDTVDVKFIVWTEAEEKQEKVLALPDAMLQELSKKTGHPVTDPWCMKLAAAHLRRLIATGQDLEKTLVTLSMADLEHAAGLRAAA